LWTDSVEGSVNDVFAFQDRLSERVVATIAPQVRQPSCTEPCASGRELDAYDFVLRGLDLLYRCGARSSSRPRGMFQRAIDLDRRTRPLRH